MFFGKKLLGLGLVCLGLGAPFSQGWAAPQPRIAVLCFTNWECGALIDRLRQAGTAFSFTSRLPTRDQEDIVHAQPTVLLFQPEAYGRMPDTFARSLIDFIRTNAPIHFLLSSATAGAADPNAHVGDVVYVVSSATHSGNQGKYHRLLEEIASEGTEGLTLPRRVDPASGITRVHVHMDPLLAQIIQEHAGIWQTHLPYQHTKIPAQIKPGSSATREEFAKKEDKEAVRDFFRRLQRRGETMVIRRRGEVRKKGDTTVILEATRREQVAIVQMEDVIAAWVARNLRVPFMSLRAVSDPLNLTAEERQGVVDFIKEEGFVVYRPALYGNFTDFREMAQAYRKTPEKSEERAKLGSYILEYLHNTYYRMYARKVSENAVTTTLLLIDRLGRYLGEDNDLARRVQAICSREAKGT